MTSGRIIGAAFFGLFVGAWLSRALFVWILDLDRGWEIAGVVGGAATGLAIGLLGALSER